MEFRLTPSRLEIGYIALSVLAIAVFAFPLWYAWKVNIETSRVYVEGTEVQNLVRVFDSEGARGLADVIESRLRSMSGDEVMVLTDASGKRLAGNLDAWPAEVPSVPGTYGLVVRLVDGSSMRVVATNIGLPDGSRLLIGRESARFQSLVQVFWADVVAAMAVVLLLGVATGWLIRRVILSEVDQISRTATAIAEGDYSRRVPARGASDELEALGRAVNGMLDQLATQNSQLEVLVSQRTAELAQAKAILEGEKALLEIIARGNPLPATLDAVCRHIEKVSPGALCSILLLDPNGRQLRHGAAPSLPESYTRAIDGALIGERAGSCGTAAFRRAPVIVEDITSDPLWEDYRSLAAEHGLRACWSAPIMAKAGSVLGTFAIYGREPGRPDAYQLETIAQVTHLVSIAIERTGAELALTESEARFRSLTELSSDFFWETDAEDRYTLIEFGRGYRGFGSSRSKLGRTRWEIPSVSPGAAEWSAHQAVIAARQTFTGFCVSRIEAGKERFYEFSGEPRFDARGEFLGYRGIGRDLTERKHAEKALRVSEERYARAMEATEAGHWEWDLRTNVVFHSPRFRELHGTAPDEQFSNREEWKARQRYLPGERERQDSAIRGAIAGPIHRYELDVQIAPRPGEIRWLRSRGKLFRDEAGRPALMAGTSIDITAYKLAEEALRLSEERYARAMEASDDGVWEWNLATDQIFVSPRARRLFGIPDGVEIASRVDMLAHGGFRSDDRQRIEDTIDECLARGSGGFEIEYRVTGSGGGVSWIRSRGKIFPDAEGRPALMTGALTDITERRQGEEELRRQRAYLDQLFELAPIAIILDSLEPRVLRVNREFTRMFGYAAEEVVGRHIRDLITPPGVSAVTDDPRWRAGERIEAEVLRRRKDGSLFHAHAIAAQIPLQGAASAGYVIYHDITERKRAEEALRASERQRRQAQRLEAMGTLAGGIAHDFNNILGAILGYGEMAVRDAPPGSRLRRDLDSILTAGERGRALVDRVLTFSRSGVGERIPVHVEKVVREALDLLAAGLPAGIEIKARLEAGRAAMQGEPTQVHQVLMNLGTNAVQAMPAGGTLTVSLGVRSMAAERTATIGKIGAADYIVLEVSDTGSGIAPEILERIFDPFFTTKEVNVGTGLGLSLVHGIVTEVDGATDVSSTLGAGSTFTVYLPRAGDVSGHEPDRGEPVLPQGAGERVLVVDDEEVLVRLAIETLEEIGYAPVGFTSSAAALEAFQADPGGFAAVITDERMPGLSGSMLIREVRRVRQSVPILLVSGYVGGIVASRAYNEGANEVLKKPLSAHELATSLARVLRLQ